MSGELTRPCKRCRTAIVPRPFNIYMMNKAPSCAWLAAWDREFCTPLCMENDLIERIYRREVWWLNNRSE